MTGPIEPRETAKAAGKSQRIEAGEELTVKRRAAFRASCRAVLEDAAVTEIVVDLGKTRWIDSTGLGMLVELRDIAHRSGRQIVLANASAAVREHLDTAHFGQLFDLR